MKKQIKKAIEIAQFTWQLPQNLIGYALVKKTKASKSSVLSGGSWHAFYIAQEHKGAWALILGKYAVFGYLPETAVNVEAIRLQDLSLLLGWFYLPFAIITSAVKRAKK